MIANRELLLPVVTRFLPVLVALILGSLVAEPLLRGRDVLNSLRHVHVPLLVAQPLLISAGYALGLWLVRIRFASGSTAAPHIFAALAAVVVLFVVSVLSQGAPLHFIVTVDTAVGLVVALAFFGPHVSRLDATGV